MVWQIAAAAGLGSLGSIFAANESADAASDAARAQTQAANRQLDLYERIYDDQRHLSQPGYQLGLQAMYGPTGLSNLLGYTTPGSSQPAPAQAAPANTNANVFSDFASGTYGQVSPAEQAENRWDAYLTANPDLMQHYSNNNVANSRHLLGGGGKGTDLDGDGVISPTEFARYHYETHGQAEGRGFGEPANAFAAAGGTGTAGGAIADGNGGYRQTNDQRSQILPAADPAPTTTTPTEGAMTATLRQTPGHQFMLDESRRAIEGSAASRGELLSGAALNALSERAMGIADTTYNDAVNRQLQVANLGQGSAAQTINSGSYFANNAGNAFGAIGNANANAEVGRANAFGQGIQGVSDSILGGVGLYGASRGWFQ